MLLLSLNLTLILAHVRQKLKVQVIDISINSLYNTGMYSGEIPGRRQGLLGRVQAQLGRQAAKQEAAIQNFCDGLDLFENDPQALIAHIAIQQGRAARQGVAAPTNRFRRGRKVQRPEMPDEEFEPDYESDLMEAQPVETVQPRPAEQLPRRRRPANYIGAIVLVGGAIFGGVLINHIKNTYSSDGNSATPAAAAPPLAIANPSQRQDIEALASDCIGSGNPQVLHITLPRSEAPSFEAIVGAVEETGKVPGDCPMPQFGALLAEDNAYQSPGLVPEPDFNPAKIEHDTKGALVIAAPQNVHWK